VPHLHSKYIFSVIILKKIKLIFIQNLYLILLIAGHIDNFSPITKYVSNSSFTSLSNERTELHCMYALVIHLFVFVFTYALETKYCYRHSIVSFYSIYIVYVPII